MLLVYSHSILCVAQMSVANIISLPEEVILAVLRYSGAYGILQAGRSCSRLRSTAALLCDTFYYEDQFPSSSTWQLYRNAKATAIRLANRSGYSDASMVGRWIDQRISTLISSLQATPLPEHVTCLQLAIQAPTLTSAHASALAAAIAAHTNITDLDLAASSVSLGQAALELLMASMPQLRSLSALARNEPSHTGPPPLDACSPF